MFSKVVWGVDQTPKEGVGGFEFLWAELHDGRWTEISMEEPPGMLPPLTVWHKACGPIKSHAMEHSLSGRNLGQEVTHSSFIMGIRGLPKHECVSTIHKYWRNNQDNTPTYRSKWRISCLEGRP